MFVHLLVYALRSLCVCACAGHTSSLALISNGICASRGWQELISLLLLTFLLSALSTTDLHRGTSNRKFTDVQFGTVKCNMLHYATFPLPAIMCFSFVVKLFKILQTSKSIVTKMCLSALISPLRCYNGHNIFLVSVQEK